MEREKAATPRTKQQSEEKTDMAEQNITYQCPSCGAPLRYDPNGKLVCSSCSNEYEVDAVEAYAKANAGEGKDFDWGDYKKTFTENASHMEETTVYVCRFCGAAIETTATTAAMRCPYCDNEIIITDQIKGGLKPNAIIPFSVDKKAAMQAIKDTFKGKKLLPNDFAAEHKLGKMQGVYVPFWLFDSTVDGTMAFDGTRVRTYSDSNYNYTETSHYLITVDGFARYLKVPVDGSEKMDNDLMDALEPYQYDGLKAFDPAYLSGFLADRFDEDPDKSLPRASERMMKNATENFRDTAKPGYTTLTEKSRNLKLVDPGVAYALLPVYLLNLKYKDKNYRYAVNGQTGKVVGELPISKAKSFLYGLLIFLAGSSVSALIATLLIRWLFT